MSYLLTAFAGAVAGAFAYGIFAKRAVDMADMKLIAIKNEYARLKAGVKHNLDKLLG